MQAARGSNKLSEHLSPQDPKIASSDKAKFWVEDAPKLNGAGENVTGLLDVAFLAEL